MSTPQAELEDKRTVYDVRGMDCAECARSVATAVERLPGVSTAQVNFGAGTLTVEADETTQVDLTPRVLHAVEVAGYRAVSRDDRVVRPRESLFSDRRTQFAIGAVVLWLVGAMVSVIAGRPDIARGLYALAVIAGAWT